MRNISIIFLITLFTLLPAHTREYLYILNDSCINQLYEEAKQTLNSTHISVIKDPQGIVLRFQIQNPEFEYKELSSETLKNIDSAISFLAKIENPAIIEVHTENISKINLRNQKNWEVSTVIANKIESVISNRLDYDKLYSVGYGEFLPSKNTSNNGVNYPNRVDIMILCNVSGE